MRMFSKWSKYQVMRRNPALRRHLPKTMPFNASNLKRAVNGAKELILKPADSSGGHGVMLVRRTRKGFELQAGRSVQKVRRLDALYKRVGSRIKRRYIIQDRIQLAKVGGRLFDIRVMVQRHLKASDWKVTGSLIKVGGAGYIITNTARSGGYVLPLRDGLKRSGVPSAKIGSIPSALERISIQTIRTLHPKYRFIKNVGIDFGVDRNGRIWIIEANFAPARSLFKRLKDKTMYRRMITYK